VLLGKWGEGAVSVDLLDLLLGRHVAVQETRMIHVQDCDKEFEL
jgi:hypothetical protein